MVGHEGWYAADQETLGWLGQGAPGSATFWAGDPSAPASTLRTVLGRVSFGGGCAIFCGDIQPSGTPIPFTVRIP